MFSKWTNSSPTLDGLVDNADLLPGMELMLGHHVQVVGAVIAIPGKPVWMKKNIANLDHITLSGHRYFLPDSDRSQDLCNIL